MVMQEGRGSTMGRNTEEPSGGLTALRGAVLAILIAGACELFFIGVNSVMARLIGH
jgi:hypothetical protein